MNDKEILEKAINDVGNWAWWAEKLPAFFQIEFGWVMLWSPPDQEGGPPPNKIALRFKNVKSIAFLTHKDAPHDFPENWPTLLQEDTLDLPNVDHDYFTFTDVEMMKEIVKDASKIVVHHGINPKEAPFWECKTKLAFWAGDVGLMVGADSFALVNMQGEIPLENVHEMSKKWWEYWQQYWDAKKTSNPFPIDNLCEVTIPIKN